MKKILLAALFSFLVSGALVSGERISVDITPEVGFLNGKINEFVYYVPSVQDSGTNSNEVRKLSELNWDVYFVPYAGYRYTINVDTGTYLGFGLKVGVPRASYAMVDRDWVNCINYPDQNWLTNYSIHQNYLTDYYNLDLVFGRKIKTSDELELSPEFFISNDYFSFYAVNGYGYYGDKYPDSTDKKPHRHSAEEKKEQYEKGLSDRESYSGKVISYSQNRVFFGVGLGLKKRFDSNFIMSGFCKMRFAKVEAEDHHWKSYSKYRDFPFGFGGILAGGTAEYQINRRNNVSLKGTCDWLPLILGEDYAAYEKADNWSADPDYLGGASSTLYSVSLNYTFTF